MDQSNLIELLGQASVSEGVRVMDGCVAFWSCLGVRRG
jgi:hypothetical protein